MSVVAEQAPGAASGGAPDGGSSARRRHAPSTSDLVLVGAYAAIGAVAAALVARGDAGGWGRGLQAAVLVAAVTVAASRARRWTLVALCVPGVVLASGWLVVAPLAGLAAVGLLYLAKARSRPWGAAIGALGGLGLLQLRDLGVPWLSTVVAGVVAVLVLRSGYVKSRSATKRKVRWLLAATAVVALLTSAVALVTVARNRTALESAVSSTLDGASAATRGDSTVAASDFAAAQARFSEAATDLGRWWNAPARAVPVVGDNLRALTTMADAGASLTATGAELATQVDYRAISRDGGGIDLAQLTRFSEPVDDAATELARADRELRTVRSPALLPPVLDRLDELQGRVTGLRRDAVTARLAVREGPALLGADRPMRYLVLLGSPSELRDVGGHLGNWAEVVVDQGNIDLVQVGQPGELSQPEADAELAGGPRALPASFANLRPGAFPQNWGGSMDFGTVARLSADLFARKTGRPVDGVIYADPATLDAMLRVTGPVPIPGLGRDLAAGQAEDFLTRGQYEDFPTESQADAAVRDLIESVIDRFSAARLPSPQTLARDFSPLVRDARLRLVTPAGTGDGLLRRVGLDQPLTVPDGGDLVAVVNRNANPSKIDAYLHRDVDHRVLWDADTGRVRARTVVDLRNDAPSSGRSAVVIGNREDLPPGTNLTDVAVLSPLRLTSVTVDGRAADVSPSADGRLYRYSTRVALGPGQGARVAFDLEGDLPPGEAHRLRVVRQPLLQDQTTTVREVSTVSELRAPAAAAGRSVAVLRGSGTDDVRIGGAG